MKAVAIAAAAIVIAMAAATTATAQVKPPGEVHARMKACLQEALATKTGLPPEAVSKLAALQAAIFWAGMGWLLELGGGTGLFDPETCPDDFGRKFVDNKQRSEWIELVRKVNEEMPADSESAATGTPPPP